MGDRGHLKGGEMEVEEWLLTRRWSYLSAPSAPSALSALSRYEKMNGEIGRNLRVDLNQKSS